MNAGNKNTPSIHHPQKWNVTTFIVGKKKKRPHDYLYGCIGKKNGHIHKQSHKNGEPTRKKKKKKKKKKSRKKKLF